MISESHKFVFVHIPRTAGTSIEKVLSPYSKPIGYRKDKSLPFSNKHNTLSVYGEKYDLKEYFTFSIVRNPIDRMRSIYKWGIEISFLKRGAVWKSNSFDEWIQSRECLVGLKDENDNFLLPSFERTQKEWISIGGKVAVNYWHRFEDLKNGWDTIKNIIGINVDLPKIHSTSKNNIECSNNSIKMIRKHFQEDFDEFGYW